MPPSTLQALGRRHGGDHPAQHHEVFLRREAGHDAHLQRLQRLVAVAVPQHLVVRGFLEVHVLEVLGHEQRQLPVQRQRGGRARGALAGAQQRHGLAQLRERGQVVRVLPGDLGAAAGAVRLHGGVDEIVLVAQVAFAAFGQRQHAFGGARHVGAVVGVQAAQGRQGVHHHRAQGLVDALVDVQARRRLGQGLGGLHLAGVDLHAFPLGGRFQVLARQKPAAPSSRGKGKSLGTPPARRC
jgi:hypothetical protein